MNLRTPLIRAGLAFAMIGSVYAFAQPVTTAEPSVSIVVHGDAPLHATLLPTVDVFAHARTPGDAATERRGTQAPLPVTVLPTVEVRVHRSALLAAAPLHAAAARSALID